MNKTTDEIVDKIGNFAASLGVNPVAGQLYMLLFLSNKPLSLDELSQGLEVSKGHVSTNIRALERWRAVKKIWVKGSRKDYYEADTNTIKIITNQLQLGLNHRLDELGKIIIEGSDSLKNTPQNSDTKIIQNRLKKIENMHRKITGLLQKTKIFTQL